MADNEIQTRDARLRGETFHRAAQATVGNIDEAARTVELTFASEFEVERWYGIEALEMTPRAAQLGRLNNGGALLSEHDRRSQIGKVVKAWIGDDKRGHAIVKFSQRAAAQAEFQDVIDGIRTNVSFGYRVLDYKTEKGRAGAPDKITATRWEALEISLVSIPADPTIGVGRSESEPVNTEPETEVTGEEREETQPEEPAPAQIEINERGENMADNNNQPAGSTLTREAEIMEIAKVVGAGDPRSLDLARQFAADSNKGIADFREALRSLYTPAQATPQAAPSELSPEIGLSQKEKRQYSIVRVLRAIADGDWSKAGYEREVSEATIKATDDDGNRKFRQLAGKNSVMIPYDILARDLSVAGGLTTGGALVATDHLAGSFIDLLRNRMIMTGLGVRVMAGLVGDLEIPRQDGTTQVYWVDEGQAPNESQMSFGQVTMTPKTMGVLTEFTRKLLLQSSPDVERLVFDDLAAVMALEYDRVVLNGSGSAGQPRGILNTTGVEEFPQEGAEFQYTDAVRMKAKLRKNNTGGGNAFLMEPILYGNLEARLRTGHTAPPYVLTDGKLAGISAYDSNQVPDNLILHGDFRQVMVGQWGVLELEANRFGSGWGAGNIQVRALQSADVAIRYPQAFLKNASAS